jgi:hypothetical protein
MKYVLREIAQSHGVHDLITADSLCEHPEVVVEGLLHDGLDAIIETKTSSGELKERLYEVTQKEWQQALREESRLLDLLLSTTRITSLELPESFRKALINHAESVLDGDAPDRLRDEWSRLSNSLSEEERETFFQELQELLLQPSGQRVAPVLELYGDPLLESGAIRSSIIDDPAAVVDNHLVHILNRGNIHELKWLLEVLHEHEGLLAQTSKNTQETFREQVIEAADGLAGQRREILEKIADVVDVDLPKEASDDSESG